MNNYQLAMSNERTMKRERTAMSTMKKAWLFSLLIPLFSFLIFLGCDNHLTSKDGAALPAGKGSFSLTLGAGRTVLPDTPALSDFAAYNLAFTPTGGGTAANVDRTNATLSNPVLLEPGTYNLVVNAYQDSEKTKLMARGALDDIVITAGQNTDKTVTLEALLSGGTGTFRWNITLPTAVSASMKITPAGEGGTAEQTVTLDGTAGSKNLVSGQYSLTFVLNKTDKTVEWQEILHVYQNLESVFTFTFTDAHLSDNAYTVTYRYNDGETADQTQSVLHGAAITKPADPTRAGYAFWGWYADAAFANAYDFDQPVIEPSTLYARWVIPLTLDTWKDGNLPTSSDQQWFRFTATAGTHYIHAAFGTLTDFYVQVYTSADATQGAESRLYSSSKWTSRGLLTVGDTYYIRVRPYDSSYSGTYQIGFNTTPYPPGTTFIPLTENQWANGDLPTRTSEQWYTFTATATTQYIHAASGTIYWTSGGVYVNVYNSAGATQGTQTRLYSATTNTSRTLTAGNTYYIRVRPYDSNYLGTYRIGFNKASSILPGAIPLTENQWADGSLPTSISQQWFSFTATATTHNIHAAPGTMDWAAALGGVYVQVYTSAGATQGAETRLNSNPASTSRASLTVGDTYYIRVRLYTTNPSSFTGTYQITFNAAPYPIGITPIPLTANQWEDGSLPTSSSQQWFTFTATASTQYIHVAHGTLTDLYVSVYDSGGTAVGAAQTNLYGNTRNTSRTLTEGDTYYIRVRPETDKSGTYQIGFTTSSTTFPLPTSAVPLTENQWTNGSLPTGTSEQWFSFTATATTHYLHAAAGTTGPIEWTSVGVNVQVYTSAGETQGAQTQLYRITTNTSRDSLSVGDTYYIKVWPNYSYYTGTYRIGFNTGTTAPTQ